MTTMTRSDPGVHEAVMSELRWDAHVDPSRLTVTVEDGVVTLGGTVASYAERLAAQEAAFRVAGVLNVANEIHVEPHGTDRKGDPEIARAVRWSLEWDVRVPHDRIQCSVSDGWVTLSGAVDTWQQREDAEQAVLHLGGVRGLVNDIRVGADGLAPAVIRQEVAEALERRATRAARRIDIVVRDGDVVVSGVVDSWCERNAVLGAVRGSRGVRSVEDHLRVEPAG